MARSGKLKQRYLVAFYDWCLAESQLELLRDYSILRALPDTSARKYVAFMESLRPERRAEAAQSIIRRYHKEALELRGEVLTQADQGCIQAFLNFGTTDFARGLKALPVEPDLIAAITSRSELDRRRLRQEVLEQISGAGFSPEPFSGKTVWRFLQAEKSLLLQTYIDFGGRVALKYDQRVLDKMGREVYPDSSIMQWHGITAATSWNLMTNELITEAARTLAELCLKFSAAFKQLVQQSL